MECRIGKTGRSWRAVYYFGIRVVRFMLWEKYLLDVLD